MTEELMMKKIDEILENRGMIDYELLSKHDALKAYKQTLEKLLLESDHDFDSILEEKNVSFENIVERYLNNGEKLGLLYGFLHHLDSNSGSELTRETIDFFQPKYVAFCNKVSLHPQLYQKLIAVRDGETDLSEEQQRSLALLIRDMEMAGVHLKGEAKERLERINLRLAQLSQEFSNRVTDSMKKFHYHFESDEDLVEMPEQDRMTAKHEAEDRKLDGWVFTLSPPSMMAVMKYCSNREVRKLFYEEMIQIATKDNDDNRPAVLEILNLRKEKAELLGCEDYAEYVLQDRMADSVDQILTTVSDLEQRARVKAQIDFDELQMFAKMGEFEPWDVSFFANKLKKEKFEIDEKKLKEYFPLKSVLAGMFEVAERLYGVTFQKLEVKSYDAEVQSFGVYRDNKLVAYFVLDLFARPTKRPGAWCNTLRSRRETGAGLKLPIVVNVANFGKSTGDSPTLLAHQEVLTMFHEFGHALHMMLDENHYSNTSSSNVEWDFVELPSQLMENWCWKKESLDLFVHHFKTGEELSNGILNSLNNSRTFMSGYNVLRQMSFLNLDLALHTHGKFSDVAELDQFCLEHERKYSLLKIPDFYRVYASFSHIFAGGYAAGYYSYIWAEILEADVFKKFEQEGILNGDIGREFEKKILGRGTLKAGGEMFEDFMGRGPKVDALIAKLGL